MLSVLIYPAFGFVGGIDSGLVDSFGEAIFFSPVTAMALVLVGALMIMSLKELNWSNPIAVTSGFVTIIMMVLCYSIAEGIAFGLIVYTLMMVATKQYKEINAGMFVITVLFIINLVLRFTV